MTDPKPEDHSLILLTGKLHDGGYSAFYVPVSKISDDEYTMLFNLTANRRDYTKDEIQKSIAAVHIFLDDEGCDSYLSRHIDLESHVGKWKSDTIRRRLGKEELTDTDMAGQCECITRGIYIIKDDYDFESDKKKKRKNSL